MRHNLLVIQTLEVGDIIDFNRGLFNHTAIVVDKERLECVHRHNSGVKPDSKVNRNLSSGRVTKDDIFDIVKYMVKENKYWSKITRANDKYDTIARTWHFNNRPKYDLF